MDDIMELPWNTHFSASFCCCWYIPWWCPDIPRDFPWEHHHFSEARDGTSYRRLWAVETSCIAMVEGWFSDAKHGGLNGFKWSKWFKGLLWMTSGVVLSWVKIRGYPHFMAMGGKLDNVNPSPPRWIRWYPPNSDVICDWNGTQPNDQTAQELINAGLSLWIPCWSLL